MTSDEQRRSDQRAERDRNDQRRADQKRETDRLRALSLERSRVDAEYAKQRDRAHAEEDAQARRRAAASDARVNAVLNDPNSYFSGHVPVARTRQSYVHHPVQPPERALSYPSAPITLRAGQEHRHPDVTGIFVEVTPLVGGGMQAGIDWAPHFGRALVKQEELSRDRWQQHRRGETYFPIELRRTRSGMSLRWLAPIANQPESDQHSLIAALLTLAATATAAGWRTWCSRKREGRPAPDPETRNTYSL